jgi:MFS family permease
MYGIGGVIGPLLAGAIMSTLPQQGMFIVTLIAHLLIVAYGALRITQNLAVREDKKSDFVGMAPGRYPTPETSALDPRSHISAEQDMDSRYEVKDQD